MKRDPATRSVTLRRLAAQAPAAEAGDRVAVEEPLEIRLNGRPLAVVMRTPGQDRELAAGFLWTEGIVRRREDLLDLVPCDFRRAGGGPPNENTLDALLAPGAAVDWARLTRHTFASSSCGLCGKASIAAVRQGFPPIAAPAGVTRGVLAALPDRLRAAQAAFARTGGLHASGLFDAAGNLLTLREDVGRHNALDKVIGRAFFDGRLPLAGTILLVSGRVSFELMQKALAAGIPAVAAISAPTSLAVEFARESGQTLAGFLREGRMNVYAGTVA